MSRRRATVALVALCLLALAIVAAGAWVVFFGSALMLVGLVGALFIVSGLAIWVEEARARARTLELEAANVVNMRDFKRHYGGRPWRLR